MAYAFDLICIAEYFISLIYTIFLFLTTLVYFKIKPENELLSKKLCINTFAQNNRLLYGFSKSRFCQVYFFSKI